MPTGASAATSVGRAEVDRLRPCKPPVDHDPQLGEPAGETGALDQRLGAPRLGQHQGGGGGAQRLDGRILDGQGPQHGRGRASATSGASRRIFGRKPWVGGSPEAATGAPGDARASAGVARRDPPVLARTGRAGARADSRRAKDVIAGPLFLAGSNRGGPGARRHRALRRCSARPRSTCSRASAWSRRALSAASAVGLTCRPAARPSGNVSSIIDLPAAAIGRARDAEESGDLGPGEGGGHEMVRRERRKTAPGRLG